MVLPEALMATELFYGALTTDAETKKKPPLINAL